MVEEEGIVTRLGGSHDLSEKNLKKGRTMGKKEGTTTTREARSWADRKAQPFALTKGRSILSTLKERQPENSEARA
jgi:hypothetical protein